MLLIIAVFIMAIGIHAQGLRSDAIKVRQEIPEQYNIIKNWAEKVWEGDNVMIIDEINVQCESFFLLADVKRKHLGKGYAGTIMVEGMLKFSHEGWKEHNRKMIDAEKINMLHVNWVDVFIYVDYELKNK